VLRCSFCAFAWEPPGSGCVYCGEAGETCETLALDDRQHRHLELCHACKSYMKTVSVRELSPFPLIAIVDLETMDLDLAAMQRGFTRPPLKEFARR
jgi:FdhE protein